MPAPTPGIACSKTRSRSASGCAVERYQALGLTRIDTRYCSGARHELLNETNRGEVTADVLGWVGKTV